MWVLTMVLVASTSTTPPPSIAMSTIHGYASKQDCETAARLWKNTTTNALRGARLTHEAYCVEMPTPAPPATPQRPPQ